MDQHVHIKTILNRFDVTKISELPASRGGHKFSIKSTKNGGSKGLDG